MSESQMVVIGME